MGDVDAAARVRRGCGVILLVAAAVPMAVYWILARYLPHLVLVEVHGAAPALAVCLALLAGGLPLVIPQREKPTDPRHNRWYIAFGLSTTLLQLTCMLWYHPVDHEILAASVDGERSVVLYRPDSAYACLRVWSGIGATALTVGEIGHPGRFSDAHFADRDTVVLTTLGSPTAGLYRYGPTDSRRIRLDHRSGRPLDHTDPCVPRPNRRSSR